MHSELISKTLRFVKAAFEECPYFAENPADGAYRLEHTLRVAHIGAEVARRERLDGESLVLACLLHDIAYSREIPAGGWNEHGRVGAAIARSFLEDLGLDKARINDICYGIAIHVDDKAGFEGERTVLALSVADADNIDRFGAFRIYDSLRYAGFYDMTSEEKLDCTRRRVTALERLRDFEFATDTARELWLENLNYQIDYFTRLLRQLEQSAISEEF